MTRRVALLAGILVLSSGPVQSAQLRSFQIGEWTAGAYSSNKTGEFNHCAASARYKSGISVLFSVNKNLRWGMGFAKSDWRLRRGQSYDIAFTVDDMTPISAKAIAFRDDAVEVPLTNSVELFNRFRRGHQLSVATAGQVFKFNLTDTNKVLIALLSCASNGGRAVASSNPFEKPQPAQGRDGADSAVYKAEAIALVANLLSLSGVQGFTIMGPDEASRLKSHAAWSASDVLGTLNILSGDQKSLLDVAPSTLIGRDAGACKGTFFSGSIPDDGGASLVRVFTTCQEPEKKSSTAYYLAVPRKKGGVYVFMTASRGSEEPAKAADSNIRAAVFKAIGAR